MSLRSKGLSATVWTTTSSVIRSLIQILRFSILARILEKEDFGVIAIVTMVLGFTQIFSDLGVSVSLYSRKEISRKEYSSLYWVSVMIAILMYGILLISTPLVSGFYEMDLLNILIPIIGLDLIFFALGRQFRVFKEKSFKFKELAMIDIFTSVLSLILAFWLAVDGYGVYSIVYSTLFASFSASAILIVSSLKSHPILLHIDFKSNKSFYKIGIYQTGTQILDYFATQLDIILMGKLLSVGELGAYNLVKQLVLRVYRAMNPIVTTVAIPLLATIKDDIHVFRAKFLQLVNGIAMVNFFAYGFMAVLSGEVLLILYGSAYLDSSNVLKVLCLWGAFSGVGSVVSTLTIITGRTDIGFKRTIVRIIVNTTLVFLGAFYIGFWGIVIAQVAYSLIIFIVNWKMIINKLIQSISFLEYSKNTLPYFFVSLLSVGAIYLLENSRFFEGNIILLGGIKLLLLGCLSLVLFKNRILQTVAIFIKKREVNKK